MSGKRHTLYADGASRNNPGLAGAGAAIVDEHGRVVAEVAHFLGTATNNVAEYTALILGLEKARQLGLESIDVRMDSKLVVEQLSGRWKVKHPGLKPLAIRAAELLASFRDRTIEHIPRERNSIADALANRAIDEAT